MKEAREMSGDTQKGSIVRAQRILFVFLVSGGVLHLLLGTNTTVGVIPPSATVSRSTSMANTSSTSMANTSTSNTSTSMTSPHAEHPSSWGGIYYCGWCAPHLGQTMFPDYVQRYQAGYDSNSHQELGFQQHEWREPNSSDVLIFGVHGPCKVPWQDFPGKVLLANGEAMWPHDTLPNMPIALKGRSVGEDLVRIGTVPENHHNHTILSYLFVWGLLTDFLVEDSHQVIRSLSNHSHKPINTGQHHAVVYANSNCAQHREKAVGRISNILPIHVMGGCKGARANGGTFVPVDQPFAPTGDWYWKHNVRFQKEYKFCFCMENVYPYREYYITEKILNPFLAGCIPIYYGTPEVFDIFNPKAFVYYDPADPGPALRQIAELSSNETAYQEMLHNQPILAKGNETLRKHFSLMDEIEGGHLKYKIRTMMGL